MEKQPVHESLAKKSRKSCIFYSILYDITGFGFFQPASWHF